MRNVTELHIRYGETDMMGVVYHANYLLYMEDARSAFLDAIGFPYSQMEAAGFMSPVVSVSCQYGTPLRYGDEAVMLTWISKSMGTKTTYSYAVYLKGANYETDKPLFTATSEHCIVDRKTFAPVSIKRSFPELFEKYREVMEA